MNGCEQFVRWNEKVSDIISVRNGTLQALLQVLNKLPFGLGCIKDVDDINKKKQSVLAPEDLNNNSLQTAVDSLLLPTKVWLVYCDIVVKTDNTKSAFISEMFKKFGMLKF